MFWILNLNSVRPAIVFVLIVLKFSSPWIQVLLQSNRLIVEWTFVDHDVKIAKYLSFWVKQIRVQFLQISDWVEEQTASWWGFGQFVFIHYKHDGRYWFAVLNCLVLTEKSADFLLLSSILVEARALSQNCVSYFEERKPIFHNFTPFREEGLGDEAMAYLRWTCGGKKLFLSDLACFDFVFPYVGPIFNLFECVSHQIVDNCAFSLSGETVEDDHVLF